MNNLDKIYLEGNISSINSSDKFIWFDVCKNNRYINKDGLEQKETSFFSARIDKSVLEKYKDLFYVGSWIVVTGIPKSYIDKNNQRKFYIHTLKIDSVNEYMNSKKDNELPKVGPVISYDPDGVMVWDGKRCESIPPTEEELKEMEDLLSEFQ